eukprot:213027-Lingulodinium_polyedra.AAC.1
MAPLRVHCTAILESSEGTGHPSEFTAQQSWRGLDWHQHASVAHRSKVLLRARLEREVASLGSK